MRLIQGSRHRRFGFTLVQILVVLAIVMIFMAMVLWGAQRVKASLERAQCMHNMKQLAFGISAFHDANGRYPVYNGIDAPAGGNVAQAGNRQAVYGSWIVHTLPYCGQQELYRGIRSDVDAYTNSGAVWKVQPGTPDIPGTPGDPGVPATAEIPYRAAIPPIPGQPASAGGPLLIPAHAAVAAVYDYTGLVWRDTVPATYNYTGLVWKDAVPLTYNQWNSIKQLQTYSTGTSSVVNGVVIYGTATKWVPDQYADPGTGTQAGYYRVSDGSGPVSPPVATAAKPSGYYRISDGVGPVVVPILIPYQPATAAVYGPPGAPYAGTPEIPGVPERPYVPANPGRPAVPGTPTIPGTPAKNLYAGTFKYDYRASALQMYRCPSDLSVGNDADANTAGQVYTASSPSGSWASTNYLANWNVVALRNLTLGYRSLPSSQEQISDGLANTVLLGEAYSWCDGKGRTAFIAWHENDPSGQPNGGLNVGGVHNFGLTYQLSNNLVIAGNRPGVAVTAPNGYPNPFGTPELIFEFQVTPKPLAYGKCPANTECCVAFTIQSGHPAGVNVATADGAVRTLRQGMTLDVWRALLLPSDGKSFSGEW